MRLYEIQNNVSTGNVISKNVYWHGSKNDFEQFELQTKALADNHIRAQPLFFSPSKGFAAQHGPYLYKVELDIQNPFDGAKIFDWNKDVDGRKPRYYSEAMTSFGERIFEAIENMHSFEGDPEDLLAQLSTNDWDVLEQSSIQDLLLYLGFDSMIVEGDGERNVAVWDPTKITIVDKEYMGREDHYDFVSDYHRKKETFSALKKS